MSGGSHEAAERRLIRIGIVTGVVLGVMLAALSVLAAAFTRDHDEAVHELGEAARFHRRLDAVLQRAVDGETAQRGYLLTGDPAFLEPLIAARRELPEALTEVISLLGARHGEPLARTLDDAVAARVAFTEETVALVGAGRTDEARARVATGEGKLRMDHVRRLVDEAHAREDGDVAAMLGRAETSRRRAGAAFTALVVVATLMGLVLAWSLRSHVARNRLALRRGAEELRRFKMVAERARDLVRIHRMDGTCEYASPSSMALLGYTPDELNAMPAGGLLESAEARSVRAMVDAALAAGTLPPPIRHNLRRKDGVVRIFETRVELAEDADPALSRFHTLSRDVTAEAGEEARLGALASLDDMTGLLNRRAFVAAGEQLLARAAGEGQAALLCFCDVNGLKVVNDTLGHPAGDQLLRDAAALLRANARAADLVARLGGDEFVVLGMVRDVDGAEVFRERLAARLLRHNDTAGRSYRVSMSMGSAVREPGETLEALLVRADAAMYRDKHGTRTAVTRSGGRIVRDPGEA